jgi:voltage-gated potassium channel Kch
VRLEILSESQRVLNRIFPQQFDNYYGGHKLALWLFALLVLMKLGISLSSIFDTYNVVRSADGIPLDTFTTGGADAVVSVTTLLGLSQFLLASLGVLALIRYRAMIPFMYVLFLVEYLAKNGFYL